MISLASTHVGAYGRMLCKEPGFFCLRVAHGESWETLWPDPDERHIVMSLNRLNISLYPGMKIAVPDNLTGMTLLDFAPFPKQMDAPGEKLLIFNPKVQAWAAYNPGGDLTRWGAGSAGAGWCPDLHQPCHTKVGNFRIYSIGNADCKSTKFPIPKGGAPMPYCMYFHGGQAFHGGPDELPGFNASHGCIRIFVDDAKWMHEDFIDKPNGDGKNGTKVVIQSYPSEKDSDVQDGEGT